MKKIKKIIVIILICLVSLQGPSGNKTYALDQRVASKAENLKSKNATLKKNVLVSQSGIRIFSAHTHTDNCYAGHNHTVNACTRGYVCCNNQDLYFGDEIPAYGSFIQYWTCRNCRKRVTLLQWESGYTNGNYNVYAIRQFIQPNGVELKRLAYISYDSGGGYYGDYTARALYDEIRNMSWADKQALNTCQKLFSRFPFLNIYTPGDALFYEYNPPYFCGYVEDTTPVCNQVVTSITPTNPNQIIQQGQMIDSTATATYLDGHSGSVNCTVSGFNTNTIGAQTVTLTYSGKVGNAKTVGTRMCTTVVTVNRTLIDTTIAPLTQTIPRFSTPSLTITALFSDGTTAIINDYTIAGFDNRVLGTQTVAVNYTYNGTVLTKNVTITVINSGIEYIYDANSRLIEIKESGITIALFVYDKNGNLLQLNILR